MKMQRKGFTLIELLVVIAIIGLLSTLAVVALGNARTKARDAKRMSDLKQVQTALELYYTDVNSYPAGSGVLLGSAAAACLNQASGWTTTGCPNPYMGTVPLDPTNSGVYVYTYTAASSSYSVTAHLEGTVGGLPTGGAGAVVTLSQTGIQ